MKEDISKKKKVIFFINAINKTRATLVFQLGYFKASGLFFDNIIVDEYSDDFKFITKNILGEINLKFKDKLGYDSRIKKIKDIDTGGKPTMMDEPIKLRSVKNNVGYEIEGRNLVQHIKQSLTN